MTDFHTATAFVARHPDAAMITLRANGSAHLARVELAVVDGRIQSTGSPGLVRARNVRRDPRCSLFVVGPHPHWVGLETEARIRDDPHLLVSLLRARHGDAAPPGTVLAHDPATDTDRPVAEDAYLARVRAEGRFLFEFDIVRAYGNPPDEKG